MNLDFLWFTPHIILVLGIIILFLGLLIPEQSQKVIVNPGEGRSDSSGHQTGTRD